MSWETVLRFIPCMVVGLLYGLFCFRRGQQSATANLRAAAKEELEKSYKRGRADMRKHLAGILSTSELGALRLVAEAIREDGLGDE